METDEIRTVIAEARRALAEIESRHRTVDADALAVARDLATAMVKLIEATESLLAEREAFSGRLRRTSAVRTVEHVNPVNSIPAAPASDDYATPSPASDA